MWLVGLCLVTFWETVPAKRPLVWIRLRPCRNRHGDTRTSPRGQHRLWSLARSRSLKPERKGSRRLDCMNAGCTQGARPPWEGGKVEATPVAAAGPSRDLLPSLPLLPRGAPLTLPGPGLCWGPTWSVTECLGLSGGSLSQLPRPFPLPTLSSAFRPPTGLSLLLRPSRPPPTRSPRVSPGGWVGEGRQRRQGSGDRAAGSA